MNHSKLPQSQSAPLSISIIVAKKQLNWRSLRHFLDGLGDTLTEVRVYIDHGPMRPCVSWLLSGLIALERAFFSRGLLHYETAIDRTLPLNADDIEPCDVIVDFRQQPAATELGSRAKFGLWTFSSNEVGRIFMALSRGASAVECEILQHTGDHGEHYSIAKMTVQSKHAVAPTLLFVHEKSVQLAIRELKRLAMRRESPAGDSVRSFIEKPGLVDVVRYGLRMCRLGAARLVEKIRPTTRSGAPFVLRTGKGELPDIDPRTGIDLPRFGNAFCADPFLFEKDGEVYCFYEEFPTDTRLGKIAVAVLSDDGPTRIGEALTASHHLSFPFVFACDGEIFLMPETVQAERIEIWRCTNFPLGWELHATAFEGELLADSVLFRQGDGWWLFANACHDSFGDFSSELFLYRIDGPDLNEITPHPLNPVVVGSDVARGGGRVFESDGRIFRFSQDNSGNIYGYGLNLMEITELSGTNYAERRVAHYTPEQLPGVAGCHHADAVAGRFVVDVRRLRNPGPD